MKDREKLKKINIIKKLKNKTELGDAALEMIILEADSGLTKYNEIIYGTTKVMKELCSNKNSKKKMVRNKQNRSLRKKKIDKAILPQFV